MKKHIFPLFFALTALSATFVGCKPEDEPPTKVAVSSVKLNVENASMSLLDTLVLTSTVLPADAENKAVSWKSSNDAVVKVDKGQVIPVAYGTATIIVTTQDGNKTDSCTIMVDFLGAIRFKTDQTWTVGSQTWSDAVVASGCKKNDFNAEDVYIVDCRQNPGHGDMFTFPLVTEHQEQLCPDGWRAPTKDDFIALDIALGGTGENVIYEQGSTFVSDTYLNAEVWGGTYGGYARKGTIINEGTAHYWSQTEWLDDFGFALSLSSGGQVYTQFTYYKSDGFMLRCVK